LSGWKTWRVFPASQRLAREQELEPLSEFGFIVTSHEVSRDGPWRIEIFGQGDKARVAAAVDSKWQWEELPDIDGVGGFGLVERGQQLEAAAGRSVRSGAERHAGVDLDR